MKLKDTHKNAQNRHKKYAFEAKKLSPATKNLIFFQKSKSTIIHITTKAKKHQCRNICRLEAKMCQKCAKINI